MTRNITTTFDPSLYVERLEGGDGQEARDMLAAFKQGQKECIGDGAGAGRSWSDGIGVRGRNGLPQRAGRNEHGVHGQVQYDGYRYDGYR